MVVRGGIRRSRREDISHADLTLKQLPSSGDDGAGKVASRHILDYLELVLGRIF
jgi:hypothetical protein